MAINIVVVGALGRMGSTIVELVKNDPDLELAGIVERPSSRERLNSFMSSKDTSLDEVLSAVPGAIVIDFTVPDATVEAARTSAQYGNPLVTGTTGLTSEQLATLKEIALKIPLIWSPNMSIGINAFLQVLPDLLQLLGEAYDLEIVELHHNKKKDAPSGTAIKLAECLAMARGWDSRTTSCYVRHGIIGTRPKQEIGIHALRGGDVVGVHTVYCLGPGERIEITHQVNSLTTFAQGALRAAKWLVNQPAGRLYNFADVLLANRIM